MQPDAIAFLNWSFINAHSGSVGSSHTAAILNSSSSKWASVDPERVDPWVVAMLRRTLPRMTWNKLGDISRRYSKVTLVAGDLDVIRAWPGFEAAGFPDDEYKLASGSVMIFDLNLLKPTIFCGDNTVRLLASFDDLGSKNIDDATFAAALAQPGSPDVWGTFEVETGAFVLLCADWPARELAIATATAPTLGSGFAVIPCVNGTYEVSAARSVKVSYGDFDRMVQVTIRRSSED
jgi:hypothetical protein